MSFINRSMKPMCLYLRWMGSSRCMRSTVSSYSVSLSLRAPGQQMDRPSVVGGWPSAMDLFTMAMMGPMLKLWTGSQVCVLWKSNQCIFRHMHAYTRFSLFQQCGRISSIMQISQALVNEFAIIFCCAVQALLSNDFVFYHKWWPE